MGSISYINDLYTFNNSVARNPYERQAQPVDYQTHVHVSQESDA